MRTQREREEEKPAMHCMYKQSRLIISAFELDLAQTLCFCICGQQVCVNGEKEKKNREEEEGVPLNVLLPLLQLLLLLHAWLSVLVHEQEKK